MSITRARAQLKGARKHIEREAKHAAGAAVGAGKTKAMEWSSGPFSLAQLAKMDHPYAKRHGTPRLEAGIINTQTGAFKSDWATSLPTYDGSTVSARLYNDNEKADFLQFGTPTMFARPIGKRLEQFVAERAVRELEFSLGNLNI